MNKKTVHFATDMGFDVALSGDFMSEMRELCRLRANGLDAKEFLHRQSQLIAKNNLDRFRWRYQRMRNDLSKKLENPRLHEIAFKTFRHWKATHEYYKTKDILHIKHILGHKRIENTLIYTHLVHFESDDYVCKIAKSIEDCSLLIEAGFEYVCDMDGVKLFRKRK